mmetsp:Transcript_132969/g.244492  ORF Transcript_132969/g.244492 Transcript_132969/m.244492 type:complete len:185 (+) Transcript_132969:78-632(+)
MLGFILVAILASSASAHSPSACPESIFGYVDPDHTVIMDSSVSPSFFLGLADFPGGAFIRNASVVHVVHYAPGLAKLPDVPEARKAGGALPSGCMLPGPPPGHCGAYVKTVYKEGCLFFSSDAVILFGSIPNPQAGVNDAGFFEGCEIDNVETFCFTPNAEGKTGMDVDTCAGCTASRKSIFFL